VAKEVDVIEIPIDRLYLNGENVRGKSTNLAELEDSIETYGVIEPIIVRPGTGKNRGKYAVVVGGRRLAAAKAIGLKKIPAIVKELTDEEAFWESASENLQREDLDIDEQTELARKAVKRAGSTRKAAERLNKDQKWIMDLLAIDEFARRVKSMSVTPTKIPRDVVKAAEIARTARYLYPDELKKQAELLAELAEKDREMVHRFRSRVIALAEEKPEVKDKPVPELVKEILEPARLRVTIEFPLDLSKGLVKLAASRGISEEEVVEYAVREYLQKAGYL